MQLSVSECIIIINTKTFLIHRQRINVYDNNDTFLKSVMCFK